MDTEQARGTIVAAINAVAPDAPIDEVRGDDDLFEVLEIDSIDLLNIVVAVHERTGIEIPERDYGKLSTLDDFAAYLAGAAGSA